MKGALVLLLLLAVVIYLRLAHWKVGSGDFTAFGESPPSNDANTAYYAAARAALDTWLQAKGYRLPAPNPAPQPGPTKTWIEYAPPRHLLRIPVLVTAYRGSTTGFDVDVHWEKEGLSWTVNEREAKARSLAAELAGWWAGYQKTHPKP